MASHKKTLLVAHRVDVGARVLGAVSAGSRHVDRAVIDLRKLLSAYWFFRNVQRLLGLESYFCCVIWFGFTSVTSTGLWF